MWKTKARDDPGGKGSMSINLKFFLVLSSSTTTIFTEIGIRGGI